MSPNVRAALDAARAILCFGSAIYLGGLAIIMRTALSRGSAILIPDGTLPYEFGFVVFLVAFLGVSAALYVWDLLKLLDH